MPSVLLLQVKLNTDGLQPSSCVRDNRFVSPKILRPASTFTMSSEYPTKTNQTKSELTQHQHMATTKCKQTALRGNIGTFSTTRRLNKLFRLGRFELELVTSHASWQAARCP